MTNQETEPVEAINPYSEENIKVLQWVTQARIYDTLMAILHTLDEAKADDLMEIHANGALMATAPTFEGVFVTDEVNRAPEEELHTHAKSTK